MSATITIIKAGNKTMYHHTGNLNELAHMITQCALRDETISEAVTRASIEVELNRQVGESLCRMAVTK